MDRKLVTIFFVLLMVSCSSTNSTVVDPDVVVASTTTTLAPTTTSTHPLYTVKENCDENNPQVKADGACHSFTLNEMWERCQNPLSDECFLEYNPTTVTYWEMGSPFWTGQYATIWNWSEYYSDYNLDWPQELADIVGSPAFSIMDNGEEYDCYLQVAAGMKTPLWGVIGIYPKPIEFSDSGPDFLWTWMWWHCDNGGEDDYTYKIGGAPILRGNFGNIDPNMRNASWTAYGVSDENWPYAEEFEISHFYWWFEDGFSIKEFCMGGLDNFTYEEDYQSVCS